MKSSILKDYWLAFLLLLVFGLFLFQIDAISEGVISYFYGNRFNYERPAFIKMIYLVFLFVTIALFGSLLKSENNDSEIKKNAFYSFIFIGVSSFFPGWIFHLYNATKILLNNESFMTFEDQWWLYHAGDFTLTIGFLLGAIFKMRPAIHRKF